jgi:uncharacterized protein
MATTSADRILSLDVIRGVAVMGIFSVNIVGMAMIEYAYFYPPAYGLEDVWDRVMWAANFLIVDGRFRSLFSILFGASTVLVIERGIAAGKAGWQVHYRRMIVLLLFGLAHYYFFWWGDILANYALVGMIAFLFWRLDMRWLLIASLVSLSLIYVPEIVGAVEDLSETASVEAGADLGDDPQLAADIAEDKRAHATLGTHLDYVIAHEPWRPFKSVPGYGFETLGLMLLGMAGYKSGFLTGSWSRKRYLQVAAAALIPSFLFYGVVVAQALRTDFLQELYWPWNWGLPTYLHPIAAMGYAAVIILLLARPGALGARFAAVGRAAFTNYLGATLIGTILFYGFGFGLFGELSRAQAWLVAPATWAVMLLWSKPWLDRFRYGPFEWIWRSLSRWRWEPMRRAA